MKELLFVFLSLCLAAGGARSQDIATINEAFVAAKNAEKALNLFTLDNSNKGKLSEALQHAKRAGAAVTNITVDQAAGVPDADKVKQAIFEIWLVTGKTYHEIVTQIIVAYQLNLDASGIPQEEDPALQSAMAFEKALQFATNNNQIKTAVDALSNVQGALNQMATVAFEQEKDYARAYRNFNEVLVVQDMIKAHGGTSLLDAEGALNDQRYYAGLAALNANMVSRDITDLFQKLFEEQYDNPFVFEALYKIYQNTEPDKAYDYLAAGRRRYPDDTGLLFAEINHFLGRDKPDQLIGILETAIEKEPDNISLYVTRAAVYDRLYQQELNEGNSVKSAEYFGNALSSYNRALNKDPEYFDAVYGIASLYYNRAAVLTMELQQLEENFSREGLELFEAKKRKSYKNSTKRFRSSADAKC